MLERQLVETYASWFRTLADATRVQILNLPAEDGRPHREHPPARLFR